MNDNPTLYPSGPHPDLDQLAKEIRRDLFAVQTKVTWLLHSAQFADDSPASPWAREAFDVKNAVTSAIDRLRDREPIKKDGGAA